MRKSALIAAVAVILTFCTSDGNKNIDTEVTETKDSVSTLLTDSVHDMVEDTDSMSVMEKEFAVMRTDSLSVGGATLYVRSNSMKSNLKLSITPLSKNQLPEMPSGMVNVTGKYAGYRFLPHGEHFTGCDATLAIPYDTLKIPDGYRESDIATYFYNEKTKRWQELKKERIDKGKSLAYASTSHFTDVVNAILKVPESPETGALTPTFISDYEPANPAAGITFMQAPKPDASGAASMSYSLNIPQGVAGLTPSLTLQYSSDGGSGWVGYGFSIPVEKIEIDSRWGAPVFSPVYESECYMLGGVQFTEKSHNHARLDSVQRVSGDKTYHLRIDGDALEIKRHGTSTKDYSWTVRDKDGTVKYFTGFDGYVSEVSAETEPSEHNQVEWLLTRIEDRHGNRILYGYSNSGGVAYLSSIEYSAHRIEFIRSKEKRSDVVVNGRLGMIQKDDQILDSIRVSVSGKPLRSYSFEYSDGEFGKKCLKSVVENDSKGDRFHSHSFDYYNDVADGLFSDSIETWKPGGRWLSAGSFFQRNVSYSDELSMINGAHSEGYSIGGGIHVSYGTRFINVNAGTSYQYARNETTGETTLTDINGDGLLDLVFTKGNHKDGKDTLMFFPGLEPEKDGGSRFGNAVPILTTPSKTVSNGVSETHNLLADAGAQLFFISGNACYSHNWQKSETRVYLQDFNADGLVDIAYNGKVYFNHIKDGTPVFTTSSQPTPCPIPGLDIPIDSSFLMSEAQIEHLMDSASRMFPRHDVVRVWRAPYTGKITIGPDEVSAPSSVDGVNVTIQHNSKELVREKIDGGASKEVEKSFAVKEGDRVYFRIQSVFDANADFALWNPTIKYTNVSTGIESGENGSLMEYTASEQFLFCGVPDVPLHKQCAIRIEAPFSKGELTDDICLVVRKSALKIEGRDTTIVSADIERRYLRAGEVYEKEPMDIYMSIDQKDIDNNAYLSFIVECNSQILWERIKWRPVVTVVGEPEPFMYVAPKYTMYNRHLKVAPSVKTGVNGLADISADFHGKLLMESDSDDFKVNFSVKAENGTALYSGPYVDGMRIQVDLTDVGKVYGSFYVNQELESVENATFTINGKTSDASVYCAYDDESMGHLYSGWGQFAYNGEGERADKPINEDELHIDTKAYDDVINSINKDIKPEEVDSTTIKSDQLKGIPSVNEQTFYIMAFNPKNERYESVAKDSYVSATAISSSRIGAQSINVVLPDYPQSFDPAHPENEATACPIQKISGEGNSFTGSVSAIYSRGDGWGKTDSYSNVSLTDINGDGYPDWINGDKRGISIQYTKSDGRLTEKVGYFSMTPSHNESKSKNQTEGVSLSSTLPDMIAAIGKKSNWSMNNQQKSSDESNNSSASISVSGSFDSSSSVSQGELTDLNGDGLPDYIKPDGEIQYNIGGVSFEKREDFETALKQKERDVYKEQTEADGSGLGVSVSICGKASAGGGVSNTSSKSTITCLWRDINGDGLPDYVTKGDGGMSIAFNKGEGYCTEPIPVNKTTPGSSSSSGMSVSCNVSAPIPVPFVQLVPGVSYSDSKGTSCTQETIMDVNGDGFPDIVESDTYNEMSVRLSNIRRTNKLKSVTNPLGGKIELDYTVAKHSYRNPNARWVMSKVEVSGGSEELGATSTKDTITYIGGCYNRCERTFLGFDTVRVSQLDTEHGDSVCRTISTVYLTNSLYSKHLPSEVRTEDKAGNVLTSVRYEYELRGDSAYGGAGVFPALVKETTTQYGEDAELSKVRTFDYDTMCNLTKYSVDGDLNAEMEYHESDVVRNAVKSIKAGDLLERRSEIDEKGDITKLIVSTGSDDAVYDMEYDGYGNLTKITRPANEKGERAWTKVRYDDALHTLPVEVSDSYGLKSTTEYDELFMLPVKTTDANGAVVKYTYDNMGRVTSVIAPQEVEKKSGDSTLSFTYDLENLTATTTHHTPEGKFEVITAIDPLSRTFYAERPSMIYASGKPEVKSVRTGKCEYDALGRKVKEYKAYLEDDDPVVLRSIEYDALDRPVKTTLSNGAVTETSYVVESNDIADGTVLNATVTDPRGNKSSQMTDGRGRTVATVRYKNNSEHDDIVVKTEYDALNRPVKVTHPNGGSSTYTYDKAGNVTAYTSPDAGTVTMKYTPQGQVLERTTPTGVIKYEYDFERLQKTTSTSNADNALTDEVFYLYGSADDKEGYNRGRLIYVKDGSGATALTYGSMGEVVKTVRRIIVNPDPEHLQTHAFVSESEYDSWGRIQSMTYPDGEVIKYGYHSGTGELKSVKSVKNGESGEIDGEFYISNIAYATRGQTATRKTGDGTVETFTYDDLDRLQTSTLASGETVLSSNTYSYDKADNITQIYGSQNNYEQQYEYDEFNRLIRATGKGSGILNGGKNCSYDVSYTYNIMSGFDNVVRNIQKYDELNGKNVSIDENNAYLYGWDDDSGRTAPTKIGKIDYSYDASGNPAEISGEGLYRSLVWDCENRLRQIDDGAKLHNYYYDYSGERTLKRFGNNTKVGVDAGDSQSVTDDADGYSAYFSPYFVETQGGRYTKHYYAGTQRMASRVEFMPQGMGEEPQQPEQAEQPDSPEQASEMASGQTSEQTELTDGSGNTSGEKQPSKEEKEAMREYQKLQKMEVAKVEASGGSESASGTEESEAVEPDLYYYHTDHLGSTTFITDRDGNVAQYLAYTPYGETFIEERDVTPYKFNGKELDAETGLYYYGARYYDPTTALWLGVDPIAEKYPDVSPYVYCAGNPVKYVDPDGRWIWENKNIQEARHYASDWGCSVRLVDGKYGKDAQIVNAQGDVIDTKPATAGNQHCAFVNIVNTLDEGGISHAGGTTYTTKQDVAVATGVVGVLSGGIALEVAGGITLTNGLITGAGILNSADDIGTNAKGESFLQQQVITTEGKQTIGNIKTAISVANIISDVVNSRTVNGLTDIVNNVVNIVTTYNKDE